MSLSNNAINSLVNVRYYTPNDIYYYTIDNRPLTDLDSNITTLANIVDAVLQGPPFPYMDDTSSTVNTITCSTPVFAQGATLNPGQVAGVKVANTNTGPATLNVNGTGNFPILSATGALQGGELVSGKQYLFSWSSSASSWLLLASTGGALPVGRAQESEQAVQLQQALTRLAPTASTTITPTALNTIVQPDITADTVITIEPGSVIGQRVRVYGGGYAVTVQPNVTSGSPSFSLPDGSYVFSWAIPANEYSYYLDGVWDGVNWRCTTTGQTIVANATQNNAAVQLQQALTLVEPTASTTITPTALNTIVLPDITAQIVVTVEPGTVIGQRVRVYSSNDYSVTVQSNVTSGSPELYFPDGSGNYSWTMTSASSLQYIDMVWDGGNWRCSTAGQTVVAPATQDNAAPQLSQLFIGNRKAVFTANGTWTVPSYVTQIWVSGCAGGGGGAGGNGSTSTTGGGGGGGGGAGQPVIKTPISVTGGHSLSISIGAGGAAGTGGAAGGNLGTVGTSGGNTVLTDSTSSTTLLTLTGGSGGNVYGPGYNSGGSGGSGYPEGGWGGDGTYMGYGGQGASGPFGGGGNSPRGAFAGAVAFPGQAGYGYGSGGSGGGATYASTAAVAGQNGAAGQPGIMIIEW